MQHGSLEMKLSKQHHELNCSLAYRFEQEDVARKLLPFVAMGIAHQTLTEEHPGQKALLESSQ